LQPRRSISHTRPISAPVDISANLPEVPGDDYIADLSDHAIPDSDIEPPEEISERASTLAAPPPPPETSITTDPNVITNRPSIPLAPHPLPPNVLLTHLAPLRHPSTHKIPTASLQLRSYSLRNLEFFADFVMRAAFYLKLPASGPVPLPKRTERWTVLKSNFINKKAQENFERITYRRLVTIYDGHSEVVERWLAFVRKWQFYGVGMKANVWEHTGLDVGKEMDEAYKGTLEEELNAKMKEFGFNESVAGKVGVERLMRRERGRGIGSPLSTVREGSLTEEGRRGKRGEDVDARE
jgi:small subunit ribosomal protein S10